MIRNKLYVSVLSATFFSGLAFAEPEITGKITYEGAQYTKSGTNVGTTTSHGKDAFKEEISARLYLDGALEDEAGSTYHIELQGFSDSEKKSNFDGNKSYTQRDPLREAYIDTSYNDWLIRAGKQQVVWGTADGMKLLDSINPTDYSEMAQNQMEDSRIPVWMLNADTQLEDGGNLQVVLSQPRENIFVGLHRDVDTSVRRNSSSGTDLTTSNGTDAGQPFILKGVDTITGEKQGFVNGVPDLGSMAFRFWAGFGQGSGLYAGGTGLTVGDYAGNSNVSGMPAGFNGNGSTIIYNMATAYYNTNLHDAATAAAWDPANANSIFEYMDRTMFSTFDAFVNVGSQYKYDMPEDTDLDLSMRYKNTTESGTNYSFNYSYNYDKNPVIELDYYNTSGTKLTSEYASTTTPNSRNSTIIRLTDGMGNYYGGSTSNSGNAILRFTETLKRAHNIGGSFDTTIENEELGPIVIRGEALYQKDVYSPVFNRGKLAIGDLPGALKMTKGDKFKYVLGADITALTNMMVSVQFIQERNLDYVDNNVDWDGSACTSSDNNCGVYTGDFASMHMLNNFKKAEKNKEFVSLYLSKPFGESGQHRWNNITIAEEGGGRWNRLDVEYTIDDNTIATAEYNKYWGDANTQFGQLESASNVQVGLKYTF